MSLTLDTPALSPTAKQDRYVVMDVLRGFALLGVMTINLYEFGGVDILITAEQLAALPSAALDERVQFWIKLFVYDKANTLFADPEAAEATLLARQAAAQSGDFLTFIALMNRDYLVWFLTGGLLGWIFYALGRFFMGAWVARRGWIQNASDHLSMFRRWLWPLLAVGLLLELVHLWTAEIAETALFGQMDLVRTILHVVATPLIAAGYVCAIVLFFHGRYLRWLMRPFAPVGQMALTNYLTQSVAIILILTSVGPGLGLAGKAGISTFLPLVLAFFSAQIVFSYFWMKIFAFGPAEWLWRTLTYGSSPRFFRGAKPVTTL